MSKVTPRYRLDMAEHSMCQPGRPGPHGLGHDGSPGLTPFHSAKSRGSRLRSSTSTRAPGCSSSRFLPDSLPYGGKRRTSKYTSPSHGIGVAARHQALDQRDHLRDVLGGLGLHVGRLHAEGSHVLRKAGDVALRDLARRDASWLARG
jgi:hypothetical protein